MLDDYYFAIISKQNERIFQLESELQNGNSEELKKRNAYLEEELKQYQGIGEHA